MNDLSVRRACVFAHYDKDNIVDDYVYYYLSHLSGLAEKVVFVTVSAISDDHIDGLEKMGIEVIVRDNKGYDFFSYKLGLEKLLEDNFDEIILCNDSVYGPFFHLKDLFESMGSLDCDFWGITDSNQIEYHVQSYFLVFKKAVAKSSVFIDFWESLKVIDNKREIINAYEVGLSKKLICAGFKSEVVYSVARVNDFKSRLLQTVYSFRESIARVFMKDFYRNFFAKLLAIGKVNPNITIVFWKRALVDGGSPFLKVALMRDVSFTSSDFDDLALLLAERSNYPFHNILNHQKRLGNELSHDG